jgi:hypothetical protein
MVLAHPATRIARADGVGRYRVDPGRGEHRGDATPYLPRALVSLFRMAVNGCCRAYLSSESAHYILTLGPAN